MVIDRLYWLLIDINIELLSTIRSLMVLAGMILSVSITWSTEHRGRLPVSEQTRLNAEVDSESHLGCVWDGVSGCHDSCDAVSMQSRCQRLSHDQASCEGEEGQGYWYGAHYLMFCILLSR